MLNVSALTSYNRDSLRQSNPLKLQPLAMSMALQAATQAALPIKSPPWLCNCHGSQYQKVHVLNYSRMTQFKLHLNYVSSQKYKHSSRRRRAVTAEAAGRSDLKEMAYRVGEEARKKAGEAAKSISDAAKSVADAARERIDGFQNGRDGDDLNRRFRKVTKAANEWLGSLAYETRRTAESWNRQFRVSEKVDEAAELFREQLKKIDSQFGIAQKSRALSMDFRMNWPRYKRELNQFLNTPLGRSIATLVFLWFALSGWLFRIIIFGTWVLPFAAPFLIGAVARNTVIEGACPACKRRFIGKRNQIIQCMNCRAVVWQPREDFSKGSANPDIIDIDIEEK